MTRSFLASADEVRAYRGGATCVRRPVRARSGLWLQAGEPVPRPIYNVGDRVAVREPFADVDGVRVYAADSTQPRAWRGSAACSTAKARYSFIVTDIVCEPLHTASGDPEGVQSTRFWRPHDLPPYPALWYDDCYFWSHYPQLAYAEWWDSMWARFGVGWNQNPMTWVVSFQVRS